MTNEDLLKARDDAWKAWEDYSYEVYRPRFYKEKVGRKLEYVNGWKSLAELQEITAEKDRLYQEWLKLHFACAMAGLPRMEPEKLFGWKEILSPYGPRWVRTSATERAKIAATYPPQNGSVEP